MRQEYIWLAGEGFLTLSQFMEYVREERRFWARVVCMAECLATT